MRDSEQAEERLAELMRAHVKNDAPARIEIKDCGNIGPHSQVTINLDCSRLIELLQWLCQPS